MMTFKEVTDEVKGFLISHRDIAERLGVSVQRIRQARLDPDADGYRPPPTGWEKAIGALLIERGQSMRDMAAEVGARGAGRYKFIARDGSLITRITRRKSSETK